MEQVFTDASRLEWMIPAVDSFERIMEQVLTVLKQRLIFIDPKMFPTGIKVSNSFRKQKSLKAVSAGDFGFEYFPLLENFNGHEVLDMEEPWQFILSGQRGKVVKEGRPLFSLYKSLSR